mgnify:CR=1 FL=1
MRLIQTLSMASMLMFVASSTFASDIAITGGKVITMGKGGTLENATVLIKDGKITKVGVGISVPNGYEIIDANGKWVTPGFMGASTSLGLNEGPSWAGVDDSDASKAEVGASLDVTWALNPAQSPFAINRIEGITRAATNIVKSKTLFSGQGAVISLGDDGKVYKSKVYMNLAVDEEASRLLSGRSSVWHSVITAFDEAEKHIEALKKKAEDDMKPKTDQDDCEKSQEEEEKPNPDRDALELVVKGELILVVSASRKADLLNVIRLGEKYPNLKIVISGGQEAWMVADKLAQANIGVIVHPIDNLPQSFDMLGATQQNAGRLEKAGVKVAIVGNGDANVRLAVQNAGNAVANGMSWQGAMASLTTVPAEMFGISDSYGTLEAGKDADVVVWDGDPLELMTSPDAVIISGENIPLVSRQTKLRDRYKDITRSPAYVK